MAMSDEAALMTAARESADFAAVSAAFKRIKNILRQAEEKGFALGSPKSVRLAPEAQQLADAAAALAPPTPPETGASIHSKCFCKARAAKERVATGEILE